MSSAAEFNADDGYRAQPCEPAAGQLLLQPLLPKNKVPCQTAAALPDGALIAADAAGTSADCSVPSELSSDQK